MALIETLNGIGKAAFTVSELSFGALSTVVFPTYDFYLYVYTPLEQRMCVESSVIAPMVMVPVGLYLGLASFCLGLCVLRDVYKNTTEIFQGDYVLRFPPSLED